MLDTSARLLRLLTVLQARRYWTGPDLSERLDVTARTLRRDIDRLRSLGYVIESVSGPGGGYQLGRGAAVPPLLLEEEEAVAVAVALRAAVDTFAGLATTAMRVFVKLDQLLPTAVRARVSALAAATHSLGGPQPQLDPEVLMRVASACRDRYIIEFDYRSLTDKLTRRRVEPLRLVHSGNRRWYLVGWDNHRDAWRTFRVDRIVAAPSLAERFIARDPPEDLDTYVSRSISAAPYPHQARVRVRGTKRALEQRIPPWCGVLEPAGKGRWILSTGAPNLDALVCQLVLIGVDFELVDAPGLNEHLRVTAERLLRATSA